MSRRVGEKGFPRVQLRSVSRDRLLASMDEAFPGLVLSGCNGRSHLRTRQQHAAWMASLSPTDKSQVASASQQLLPSFRLAVRLTLRFVEAFCSRQGEAVHLPWTSRLPRCSAKRSFKKKKKRCETFVTLVTCARKSRPFIWNSSSSQASSTVRGLRGTRSFAFLNVSSILLSKCRPASPTSAD